MTTVCFSSKTLANNPSTLSRDKARQTVAVVHIDNASASSAAAKRALTSFVSAEVKPLPKTVSPKPNNDNPGWEYFTGWRCSRGRKTMSPPRGGRGRAW
uniref:Uncharacterized protein n=1 Tax=Arundo donax TaxID=35708 RepID=A0A0A9G9P2_ARUDO